MRLKREAWGTEKRLRISYWLKGIAKSRVAKPKVRQNFRSTEKLRVAVSQRSINGGGEVVLYEAPDGQIRLDVRLEQDTVWLTQAQMAELFGKNVRTVSEHVTNIFKEKELDESSVIRNFRLTARQLARNYRGLLGGSKENDVTSGST
jgi:hypothetical protein